MLRRLLQIAIFAAASTSLYASQSSAPPAQSALLPTDFAGWHQSVPPQQGTAPEAVDAANATILREYGFTQFASAEYAQPNNKLSVRAIRFQDATGAYGAFTFYRHAGMRKADIGNDAALDGAHVLFWTGTTLVDATFDHPTATSAAQLRELTSALPRADGPNGIAPPLPKYLPAAGLDAASLHYAVGPLAYAQSGGVLPPAIVGFDRDAETVTVNYSAHEGNGTLTLLMYPTPQMAIDREGAIQSLLKVVGAGNSPQTAWPQPLAESAPAGLLVRRDGPLVAITSGSFSANAARKLLNSVHYTADITWNHPEGYVSEASKAARMLLGISYLTGILGGAAIILGLFFGAGHAIVRRMRGKPVSTLNDDDFISLKLR